MDEDFKLVLQDGRGISHRIFRRDRAIGFDGERQLVIVKLLTNAGIINLIGNLTHRRIERIDRNKADRRISRAVGNRGNIALAGVGSEFHVERCAIVEVTQDKVGVHHFDVTRHHDVARFDFAGAGGRKLETLRAFAFHLQRDLLHIEDDVGHVFAHANQRREFMEDIFDLDRGNRSTLKRRQENATQRVTERQAETALQRFGNKSCLALGIAARLDFEAVGLLQFLPVLHIDSHGLPLKLSGEKASGVCPVRSASMKR